jgi:PKD domain-containing protein
MRAMIWLAVAMAGAGLVTACKDQGPVENAAPAADFSFQCSALTCDFRDASTDDVGVKSWTWSFGARGSNERNPVHIYDAEGNYPVSLTVTDGGGKTSTKTKTVDPKAPVVTTLTCEDGTAPGGFVACTLKLEAEAGFKVVLNSSSCEAHGNTFRVTVPVVGTLTSDGCYATPGSQLIFGGPFPAGTEISAEVVAPLLANPPQLIVAGDYEHGWTLTYEDGGDTDFNDLVMTLTALPTGN